MEKITIREKRCQMVNHTTLFHTSNKARHHTAHPQRRSASPSFGRDANDGGQRLMRSNVTDHSLAKRLLHREGASLSGSIHRLDGDHQLNPDTQYQESVNL